MKTMCSVSRAGTDLSPTSASIAVSTSVGTSATTSAKPITSQRSISCAAKNAGLPPSRLSSGPVSARPDRAKR